MPNYEEIIKTELLILASNIFPDSYASYNNEDFFEPYVTQLKDHPWFHVRLGIAQAIYEYKDSGHFPTVSELMNLIKNNDTIQ